MIGNVVQLHPRQPTLAGYIRVGYDGHRTLEHMLKAGRLHYKRIVFDAAYIDQQRELLGAVKATGCEVVLDTNFSEMFFQGKFDSTITRLPWANHDRPWRRDDFIHRRNFDVARSIAEFAIKYAVDAILLSSGIIGSESISEFGMDCSLCESLRSELDKCGGSNIRIDFLASLTSKSLNDQSLRKSLFSGIASLPIDNVWLRLENFGATSTGVAAQAFITGVQEFHGLGKPLVIDYAGGLVGLSTLAFGATGGICHGIGVKEAFDLSHWKKKSGGGGGGSYVYVAELDKKLKSDQLTLFLGAKGSKSKFACNDHDCCSNPQDMIDRRHEHFITQRTKQLSELGKTPDDKKVDAFIVDFLGDAVRKARASTQLKLDDVPLKKSLNENKKRLVRLEEALVALGRQDLHRSTVPEFRGGRERPNVVLAS